MRYGWRASFYVFSLILAAWAIAWFIWFGNNPTQKRGVTRSELDQIGISIRCCMWLCREDFGQL
jgi:hypothetical protein